MNLSEFILSEGLLIIPALWIIGVFIKRTDKIKDAWIPIILLIISLLLTPLKLGGFTADNILQAILLTGAAVFGHQTIVQMDSLIGDS